VRRKCSGSGGTGLTFYSSRKFRKIVKREKKNSRFLCFARACDLIFRMKEKVGIGIIGTGFARKVQIPAFLECSGARVVSVASGQLKNAEETAREFKVGHFTDNWRETVEREDVDLICITTPPDTHFEMTLRAIELGKHRFVRKADGDER
jgi:hypothetical protein